MSGENARWFMEAYRVNKARLVLEAICRELAPVQLVRGLFCSPFDLSPVPPHPTWTGDTRTRRRDHRCRLLVRTALVDVEAAQRRILDHHGLGIIVPVVLIVKRLNGGALRVPSLVQLDWNHAPPIVRIVTRPRIHHP